MPTMIDFQGDYGTRYAVYEAELNAQGKPKIARTIFRPHPAQAEFFSATEKHVLLHGNRGCGKSASLLWKAIQTAYLVPGCRVAIYRKTWPELKRSLWDEMLKLPTDLYQDLNLSDHTAIIARRPPEHCRCLPRPREQEPSGHRAQRERSNQRSPRILQSGGD